MVPEGMAPTASCAVGRSRAPTRAAATASRSPPTSGTVDAFDRAILEFSQAYADQNERDYSALAAAVKIAQDQSHKRALTGERLAVSSGQPEAGSAMSAC